MCGCFLNACIVPRYGSVSGPAGAPNGSIRHCLAGLRDVTAHGVAALDIQAGQLQVIPADPI